MTAADRASGVFFVLFGLAMYFRVNPTYIETVDGGNLAPDTLPNVMALVIAACGALLVVKPSTHMMRSPRLIARAGLYSAVLAAGTFAMSHFGFEIAGPVLALAIMWLIGERRPLWLAGGVIVMPAATWFLVAQVLGRALP